MDAGDWASDTALHATPRTGSWKLQTPIQMLLNSQTCILNNCSWTPVLARLSCRGHEASVTLTSFSAPLLSLSGRCSSGRTIYIQSVPTLASSASTVDQRTSVPGHRCSVSTTTHVPPEFSIQNHSRVHPRTQTIMSKVLPSVPTCLTCILFRAPGLQDAV